MLGQPYPKNTHMCRSTLAASLNYSDRVLSREIVFNSCCAINRLTLNLNNKNSRHPCRDSNSGPSGNRRAQRQGHNFGLGRCQCTTVCLLLFDYSPISLLNARNTSVTPVVRCLRKRRPVWEEIGTALFKEYMHSSQQH